MTFFLACLAVLERNAVRSGKSQRTARMSAEHPREYLLATACIAVLVSVAFFAAYSGSRSELGQQGPKIIAEEPSKHSDEGKRSYGQKQSPAQESGLPKSVSSDDLPKERTDGGNVGIEQAREYWPSPIFGARLKITIVFSLLLRSSWCSLVLTRVTSCGTLLPRPRKRRMLPKYPPMLRSGRS